MSNTAPALYLKAKAVAEFLQFLDENPPELALMSSPEQCAACAQPLEETGATTTKHKILQCCNCGRAYVRDEHTLELHPVYGFDGF